MVRKSVSLPRQSARSSKRDLRRARFPAAITFKTQGNIHAEHYRQGTGRRVRRSWTGGAGQRYPRCRQGSRGWGDDPRQEVITWVLIEEVKPGCLFAGGADQTSRIIPVIVFFTRRRA